MSAEEQIKAVKKLVKNYRKEINKAVKDDCEVNLGGNGINGCEADATFSAFEEDLKKIFNS